MAAPTASFGTRSRRPPTNFTGADVVKDFVVGARLLSSSPGSMPMRRTAVRERRPVRVHRRGNPFTTPGQINYIQRAWQRYVHLPQHRRRRRRRGDDPRSRARTRSLRAGSCCDLSIDRCRAMGEPGGRAIALGVRSGRLLAGRLAYHDRRPGSDLPSLQPINTRNVCCGSFATEAVNAPLPSASAVPQKRTLICSLTSTRPSCPARDPADCRRSRSRRDDRASPRSPRCRRSAPARRAAAPPRRARGPSPGSCRDR